MKTLSAIMLCLMLVACKSNPAKINQISGETVKPAPRTPPAEAMVECAKPGKLSDNSFGSVVRKLSEAIGLLDECASKQKQQKEWIEADPVYAKKPKK